MENSSNERIEFGGMAMENSKEGDRIEGLIDDLEISFCLVL